MAATSLLDADDHVAYGLEGAERIVGDLDVEGLFDLEGDVDLVEGVDVELFEGAGERDGVGGDVLGLGDDVDQRLAMSFMMAPTFL